MDDQGATFAALTVTLTVVSALLTWVAYRRRGVPAGLTGAGVTLLFPAAYLTRTLRMFSRIVDAVVDWATTLVLSPAVWAGIVLAGLAVVLLGTARALKARDVGTRRGGRPRSSGGSDDGRGSSPTGEVRGSRRSKGEPAMSDDDDLADVEAILRKRGIS